MLARARSLPVFLLALACLHCAPAASEQNSPAGARPPAPAASAQELPAWARHRLLGQCFPTARDFVVAVAGAQGPDDENIRVRPADPLADGSTWVVDQTPQTNFEWYLLQPGDGAKLCLTLFVPVAAQVILAPAAGEQTAESKTQASPDFPVKAVRFVRPAGQPTFHPAECAEITYESRTASRKPVSCAGFFD